ncbi:DUF2786 domain-containing protein [Phytomonospora endophytica]|uniref:DUF2786 domain-containing protein n=1 Tax=Phytomonospora endophytica TaxID=714109 RepID=A0A841FMI9_9ACTN|nr:DUF2786 domain-containing protein [Phytomonospora endophytica]MBB6034762.1 hypothetical protein [Phytomonospora endophytica]GIG69035.1 hypothetical protein Pen01_53300 [Phytomonospora endophytica]
MNKRTSAVDPATTELVEQAFAGVIAATDAGLDLALDLGASKLAASAATWPEVGSALLAYGEAAVGRAWTRGWRPADLARVARRELGPEQVALAADLIAAEGRRHAVATLDRRWVEQLRELSADQTWWSRDEEFLPGFTARHRLDRFSAATAALELLRLWARLPAITPVAPAPGEAPREMSRGPVAGESPMLSRIRALLAKAESTDFPDEAEALTAKAQELMARHSIDEALLSAGRPGDAPGALRIGVDAPYESPKAMLLDAVADANRCRAVWSKEYGFCTIVGFDADLDAVDLLYTSLLVQATAAMQRAGDKRHQAGAARTKSFRQSFLVAYAIRIGERLAAAAAQVVDEATAGLRPRADGSAGEPAADERLLPVLAAREVAVDDAVDEMFGKLTSRRVRIADDAGWYAGREAADRASLRGRPEAVGR